MRSIFPSAAILRQKYALVSSLRALGLPVASIDDAKPAPGDVFLIADGEVPPAPARTVIVGGGGTLCRAIARRQSGADRLWA